MIMERMQECTRMVKRTRWIDAQLMKLHSGTERTPSVLDKTPSGTGDSVVLEAQLDAPHDLLIGHGSTPSYKAAR